MLKETAFELNYQRYAGVDKYFYILFLFFTVTRPITLIDIKIPYFLDLYAILFGYLFLLYILLSASRIPIDRTQILIFIFIFFCTFSFTWGSNFKEFSKLILPFVFFSFTRICITHREKIDNFFSLYLVGFILPLILSAIFIALGLNIQIVEWLSKVPRHAGAYNNAHTLAYQMSFFFFFFCYNHFLSKKQNSKLNKISWFMAILSLYCLYNSHTRTAYIGFILFWCIFLYGYKKKLFLLFVLIFIVIGLLFSPQIKKIFLKEVENVNFNTASSGRGELWEKYIDSFNNWSLPEKIIGKGIGWSLPGEVGTHNEWLRLLTETGIFGLILYLSILFSILFDIYLCKNFIIKYYFGAIIIPLIIMSSGSNVIISFFEVSILFWIIIGIFYNLNNLYEINKE